LLYTLRLTANDPTSPLNKEVISIGEAWVWETVTKGKVVSLQSFCPPQKLEPLTFPEGEETVIIPISSKKGALQAWEQPLSTTFVQVEIKRYRHSLQFF